MSAALHRIHNNTTDPVQKLMLHPKNPLRLGFHRKATKEVRSRIDKLEAAHPDRDKFDVRHAIKKDTVRFMQESQPKGSLASPAEAAAREGKLLRQKRLEAGPEVRKHIDDALKKK